MLEYIPGYYGATPCGAFSKGLLAGQLYLGLISDRGMLMSGKASLFWDFIRTNLLRIGEKISYLLTGLMNYTNQHKKSPVFNISNGALIKPVAKQRDLSLIHI